VGAALLDCALEDLAAWPGPRVIAPADPGDADWARALLDGGARVVPQPPGNLGERLNGVDAVLRAQGLSQLLYVGTDAPALDQRYFATAAAALAAVEVVLGPALDGGVTLMGTRRPWPALDALPWSEAGLGAALARSCRVAGARIAQLAPSFDVDAVADLAPALRAVEADARPARRRLCEVLAPLVAAQHPGGARAAAGSAHDPATDPARGLTQEGAH
jgi:hypothetical protein